MAIEVIVKLIECLDNFTQNIIIFSILLPIIIYGFKSLYLLLKSYLDDKKDENKPNYRG